MVVVVEQRQEESSGEKASDDERLLSHAVRVQRLAEHKHERTAHQRIGVPLELALEQRSLSARRLY